MKNLAIFFLLIIFAFPIIGLGQISITSLTFTYTQDFNTLPSSGTNSWINNTTLAGWYTDTTTLVYISSGTSTGARVYSYGAASGNTERALGGLCGSSVMSNFYYGVRFINNTGSTITSIPIQYTGEQWRQNTSSANVLAFSYQVGATSITSGTWTACTNLDFTSLHSGTAGALDGNASANRTVISYTLPVVVSDGQEIWFRWYAHYYSPGSQGLAIDDFVLNVDGLGLPVEMTSFTATMLNTNNALLTWSTATEVNNRGFEIERRTEKSSMWTSIGFVAGAGVSNVNQKYSYQDVILTSGVYVYRIKQIDNDGAFKYSASTQVDAGVSKGLELVNNYPNPFNPTTELRFSVPENGYATLKVYNVLGQEVATLFDGVAEAGHYITMTFNAGNIASGVYFSRLQYNGKSMIQRMLLMK
jgi:hypothetical protein